MIKAYDANRIDIAGMKLVNHFLIDPTFEFKSLDSTHCKSQGTPELCGK